MTVLSLDCTSAFGSVAVWRQGVVLAEQQLQSDDGFGHLIFDMVEAALQQASLTLPAIDCFAAAAGPGSFTGVRVGLAVAKGLAEAGGKAAVGVSNLQALASCGSAPLRAPILDARRGEVFAAVYDRRLGAVQEETAGSLAAFLETLREDVEVIVQDRELLRGVFSGSVSEAPRYLATAVARCAAHQLREGATGDPALLDANYVRRSDAELFWRDK